ncbi:MAG: class II aldolase/adducin family protein [Ruminococcaceae bacterium]|nr:class II aldolase/adducin family protein [Oscillospiraceae bacterium]
MAYEMEKAKELVVKAGKRLVETGLIARTWGNVSARISDTQFVITPSGRAYETLTPEEIVVVNIEDCSYDGEIKPSSEKGIHAAAYKIHPDIDFVIHSHQIHASALSPLGRNFTTSGKHEKILGPVIPCAAYAMPSTNTLRDNVAHEMLQHPDAKAFILRHHGAVCIGTDYDDAFKVAETLEDFCKKQVKEIAAYVGGAKNKTLVKALNYKFNSKPSKPQDLGESTKITDNTFELKMADNSVYYCTINGNAYNGVAPRVSLIHAQIYKHTDATHISFFTNNELVALSKIVNKMKPHLDDFAQITGPAKVKNWELSSYRTDAVDIGKAFGPFRSVLVRGHGALCIGKSRDEVEAVKLVLHKEAIAEAVCLLSHAVNPISSIDNIIMRAVYVFKYSKLK